MATYEKTGSLLAGTMLSGRAAVLGATGAAVAMTGQVMVQPAAPDPALHLVPDHYDLTGQGVMLSFAFGGVVAVSRAVRWRDIL